MEIYRAAIVGCGRKGSTIDDTKPYLANYVYLPASHAAAYAQLPNVEIVAAASRTRESLRAFGERWGVRALYTDYREMLMNMDVLTKPFESAPFLCVTSERYVPIVLKSRKIGTHLGRIRLYSPKAISVPV